MIRGSQTFKANLQKAKSGPLLVPLLCVVLISPLMLLGSRRLYWDNIATAHVLSVHQRLGCLIRPQPLVDLETEMGRVIVRVGIMRANPVRELRALLTGRLAHIALQDKASQDFFGGVVLRDGGS